jgi:hypothetical protein
MATAFYFSGGCVEKMHRLRLCLGTGSAEVGFAAWDRAGGGFYYWRNSVDYGS